LIASGKYFLFFQSQILTFPNHSICFDFESDQFFRRKCFLCFPICPERRSSSTRAHLCKTSFRKRVPFLLFPYFVVELSKCSSWTTCRDSKDHQTDCCHGTLPWGSVFTTHSSNLFASFCPMGAKFSFDSVGRLFVFMVLVSKNNPLSLSFFHSSLVAESAPLSHSVTRFSRSCL